MLCSSNFPLRSDMVASISLWSSCMSHIFFPPFQLQEVYVLVCLLKDLGNTFLTNLVVTNRCSYKQLAEECFQADSHTIPVLSMTLQRLGHLSPLGSHYAMPALANFYNVLYNPLYSLHSLQRKNFQVPKTHWSQLPVFSLCPTQSNTWSVTHFPPSNNKCCQYICMYFLFLRFSWCRLHFCTELHS